MTTDILYLKCKCGESLISISYIENNKTNISNCARYYFCTDEFKRRSTCSPQNTPETCQFFSETNKISISCPKCGVINELFLPLSKTYILPGMSNFKQSNNIFLNKYKISSIEFNKECTIINLEKNSA